MTLKQFAIRLLLSTLRGMVFLKQKARPTARALGGAVAGVGRFLLRVLGVPLYRLAFWTRRRGSHFALPVKNRTLYFVSNRYVFHVAIVGIVAMTSALNLQGSEVRAETFGQDSLLFSLVNADGEEAESVEEVTSQLPIAEGVSYVETFVLSPEDVADVDILDEEYVTTTLGGSTLLAPTMTEDQKSVAPRTETEPYAVQEGDTLSTIAETYGLNLSSLLWANSLTLRSTIKPGQELKIPPIDGVLYTVKKGDTVNSLAKTYTAEAERIIAFNSLAEGGGLQIGQTIVIPDGEPPKPPSMRNTAAPLAKLFSSPSKGSASGSTPSGWVWPTSWHVITQYFGPFHSGVDIDGDYNTDNIAARGGTVVRAGWYIGYGLCVDIDHGDGYMTRYGHFSKIFVEVGQQVSTGEVLGKTGTTGRSTGTHLHFEVRKDGKALNPLQFVR